MVMIINMVMMMIVMIMIMIDADDDNDGDPILNKRICVILLLLHHAHATPLDSERRWIGELWSNRDFLILKSKIIAF